MKVTQKLIEANPVKAAAEMAKVAVPETDPEEARRKLVKIRKEIAQLESLKANLLPIEASETDRITRKVNKLKKEEDALARSTLPTIATLPIFDLECLTWRDEQGFPRLVPFAVGKSTFTLGYKARRGYGRTDYRKFIDPKLPQDMHGRYDDVFKTVRKQRKPKSGITLSTKFAGALPDHIRDLILAGEHQFQGMWVLAEVKDWKIFHTKAEPVPSVQADPILIGFDGQNYRLVATFDVTTVEQIAIDRSKGKKPS